MTKEDLKKNIDEMEIYIPIRLIERNLAMPKTTIQQVLNGHRNLPKKWVKVLERYFSDKLYLGKADKHEIKVGDKVSLPQDAIVDKVEKNNGATTVSFSEPMPIWDRKEKWDVFVARKNKWHENNNK